MTAKKTLFEATIAAVYELGFHGSSIHIIAKAAQTNSSNIYHYFASKDDLIIESFMYVKAEVENYIFNAHPIPQNGDYQQTFKHIFRYYIDFFINKPYHLSYLEQFAKSPYLKKATQLETYESTSPLRAFMQRGITEKYFICEDLKIVKIFILGSINELTFHVFKCKNTPCESQIELSLAMLWNALSTPMNPQD